MSKRQVSFLNTFDYELFLGVASGTPENCLLKPTELLLQVLRKQQLPAIFFIDATYLYRLKEIAGKYTSALGNFKSIVEQLKQIKREGHSVFLHLHPHWIDAVYDNKINQWDLSNSGNYSFQNLSDSQRSEVFQLSYELLEEVVGKSENTLQGFRAGGLYVQPFAAFCEFFIKYGIQYDFSVLRYAHSIGQGDYSFDFTKLPRSYVYRFDTDVVKKVTNGKFIEFTINSIKMNVIHRAFNKIERNLSKPESKKFGDGLPSGNRISYQPILKGVVWETMGVEYLSRVKEELYFSIAKKQNYLHLLSHPKLITVKSLCAYDRFLKRVKEDFEIISDLNRIIQIQDQLPQLKDA